MQLAASVLGRDREFALLRSSLSHTLESGQPNVVLVRGEPGIGKSTLLRAFVSEAPSHATPGLPILAGYGQAMTNSLTSDAFQAVRECLRSLVGSAEQSGSRALLNRVASAFRVNAPDWLESVPLVGSLLAAGVKTGMSLAQAEPREQLVSRLDQLTGLVSDLTQAGGLVLVLDDLHWADGSTIDVIMALALKVSGPVLLVLAYRPDDLRSTPSGEPHPLTRAVFRLRRYLMDTVEIDLERLSPADTRELIRLVDVEHRVGEAQVRELVAKSAGIPLYAESLALVQARAGTDAVDARSAATPRAIDAVLEERLSFAGQQDQRLLEAAIVVGYTFEVDFLAELTRTDIDELYERLDLLARDHHVIVPAAPVGSLDRYSLYHPMLAEVLARRAAANPPRWRRLHQRLVDVLLTHGQHRVEQSDELASRAARAALVAGDRRGPGLALRAAQRQYAAGAVTQARRFAEDAMQAAGETPAYLEAAELLALCLSVQGDDAAAAAVCAEALGRDATAQLAPERREALMLSQARSLRMTSQWSAAAAVLDRLESQADHDGRDHVDHVDEERERQVRELRARILVLRAELALCGGQQDTSTCISLCEEAVELSGDVELVSRALGHRGLAHLAAYAPDAAERWLKKAIRTARDHRHPYSEYEAVHWYSKKKMACLELDEAWDALEQLAQTSDDSGVASESPYHLRDSSRVMGLRGSVELAGSLFARYADAAPGHQIHRVITTLACQVAELDEVTGADLADRFLREVAAAAPGVVVSPDSEHALLTAVDTLRARRGPIDPAAFAVDRLGCEPSEARGADAIFRFDVPDLARLRRLVRAR